MYSKVVFKDKKDFTPEIAEMFPGATFLGTMQKPGYYPDAEILCVKYSSVGEGMLKAMPGLKWVVTSSTPRVLKSIPLLMSKNIGVVACHQATKNVATYILEWIKKIDSKPPYLLVGYGHIGREVARHLIGCTWGTIVHRVSYEQVSEIAKGHNTIILSIDNKPDNKLFLNKTSLKDFSGDIISVADGDCMDNWDILDLIRKGQLRTVVSDTPNGELLSNLVGTGKFFDTHHTAWTYNFDLVEYYTGVKNYIDKILSGKPEGIVIEREDEQAIN